MRSAECVCVCAFGSPRLPLAHLGTVRSLLGAPVGRDPAHHVVWCRHYMLRRYLAYSPLEVHRIYQILCMIASGVPGHVPIHMLISGFRSHLLSSSTLLPLHEGTFDRRGSTKLLLSAHVWERDEALF